MRKIDDRLLEIILGTLLFITIGLAVYTFFYVSDMIQERSGKPNDYKIERDY